MPGQGNVERGEWQFVAGVGLAVVVLSSLPLLYCQLAPPRGMVFSGFNCYIHDQNTYLMWTEQAREGRWLFEDRYTTEPQRAVYANLLWLATGRLARALGVSSMFAYQLARVVLAGAMVFAFYFALAQFLAQRERRRLCLLVLAFGSGLGWVAQGLGLSAVRGVDLWMPEAYPFSSALAFPHFCLSWALIALLFACAAAAAMGNSWPHALCAALAMLALGFSHTYHIVSCAAALVLWGGYLLARNKEARRAVKLLPAVLAALPPAAYFRWATASEPWMRYWNISITSTTSGPVWEYAIGFGPLLFLFALALGSRERLRRRREVYLLLGAWVGVCAVLLYWPWVVVFQRRFSQGLAIPLSVVATDGFYECLLPAARRRWASARAQAVLRAALVCFLALGQLVWLAALSTGTRGASQSFYHERDMVAALRFLAAHAADGERVMSLERAGLWLPGACGVSVFVGSHDLTVAHRSKLVQAARFFSSGAADQFRRKLLREHGITWVWVGPDEARRGWNEACAARLGLTRAFAQGRYSLYRTDRQATKR